MNYLTTSPVGYEQLTHAYNLMNEERHMMENELTRLRKKGADVVAVMWDTRGTEERTQIASGRITRQESVWGAIWKKEESK